MAYIQTDETGNIVSVFACQQDLPNMQCIPDDDPCVIAFANGADPTMERCRLRDLAVNGELSQADIQRALALLL